MKRFILHSILFLSLVIGTITFVMYQADGYTDPFYVRFTSPPQHSLILGTSKAAQGLRPDVMNTLLPDSIYNYAFTVAHSPYGPAYLQGIKQKLAADTTRRGTFIVTVDAWSISDAHSNPNDTTQFDENKSFLNQLTSVSSKPNFSYLLSHYKNNFAKIFDRDTVAFLHDDGWLEINTRMQPAVLQTRIQNKKIGLQEKMSRYQLSRTRLSYLYKTIAFLKKRGEVFVVTLPVHPELSELDSAVIPEFTELMYTLSRDTFVPYLDLSKENSTYTYTDGIHLYKDSAKEVSERVARWVLLESRRK